MSDQQGREACGHIPTEHQSCEIDSGSADAGMQTQGNTFPGDRKAVKKKAFIITADYVMYLY